MVGFWRVANRAKKIYKKRFDFMLAGSRLIVAVAIFDSTVTTPLATARDDDKGMDSHG